MRYLEEFKEKTCKEIRELIFADLQKRQGMIYTLLWAFDFQSDWGYVYHVMDIFNGSEFYC